MSDPQAKRRRLNEAAKTLKKPFKSPFRTPLRPGLGSDPPSSDPPEINAPCTIISSAQGALQGPDSERAQNKLVVPKPQPLPPAVSSTPQPRSLLPKPSLGSSRTLSKTAPSKPSISREIMLLRNEIQILTQAQALATSSQDEDLVVLIDRWRVASRAAAEELFATTRDKVNRMGGVGAWKAREKEHKERQTQWGREEMEAEREKLEEARENGEIGDEAYDRWAEQLEDSCAGDVEKEEEKSKAADDESFTMDMMLKTLNIDLELIGYNKETQRWEG